MAAEEAATWRATLVRHYHDAYGLKLHPLQSDPAIVPPRRVVQVVQGRDKDDPTTFFGTGYREMFRYVSMLHRHGQSPTRMDRMLDFGVGTGRILVHFLPFALQRFGCDITPEALAWTSATLGAYATLQLTSPEPPLPFPDGYFDLVLATSVFTHLAYAAQPAWIRELARILRPGGHVLATMHTRPQIGAADQGCRERHEDRGIHRRVYFSREKAVDVWSAALSVVDLDSPASGQALVMAGKPGRESN